MEPSSTITTTSISDSTPTPPVTNHHHHHHHHEYCSAPSDEPPFSNSSTRSSSEHPEAAAVAAVTAASTLTQCHVTDGNRTSATEKSLDKAEQGRVPQRRQDNLTNAHHYSSPFATRQGKCLWFRHVSLKIVKSKDNRTKILSDCWGNAPAGQVTAILGSSGSGKTSLLNVLSGRLTNKSSNIQLQLQIQLDSTPVNPAQIGIRKMIAFVAQEDSLMITSTPREAILFSARLRLPKTKTVRELQALTENMLEELRLTACTNTMVGSPHFKGGISGGERKRTSVGVELVTQPSLIFLDEATSGLDSFNALELVTVLKKVAFAGSAVLVTIHQPSSEIFSSLDNLILLEKGRVLYGGKVQTVPTYFAARGYPCPAHYNPADWILNIAQTVPMEQLEAKGFFALAPREHDEYNEEALRHIGPVDLDEIDEGTITIDVDEVQQEMSRTRQSKIANSTTSTSRNQHTGFILQTKLLFLRELRNVIRNKKNLGARTGMTVMASVLGGIIFFQIGKTDFREFINVQSTFGALLMSLLANVFSTALPSLVAFPEERPVFIREYSTNHYSVAAYFGSRLAMEALVTASQVSMSTLLTYFLMGFSAKFGIFWATCYLLAMTSTALGVLIGCAVKDPGVAVEFLPMTIMPQILFAGFFVPPDLIPVWLRWLQYIFPLTYAVKLLVIAEFQYACNGLVPNICDRVLFNVQADPEDMWWYWIVLVSQFVVFRLVALFVLRLKASRFY